MAMKFLLDTNVIIPAEPTSQQDIETEMPNVTELLGLVAKINFQIYIHPASLTEMQGDRNAERREMRRQLLTKYVKLPSPPPLTPELTAVIGIPKSGSHNAVDALLLGALMSNAVNFLVTNDNGIHRWSEKLKIAGRVLTIAEALVTVRGLMPEAVAMPPAVELVHCHNLRKSDAIFDSLREDYDRFDRWLEKAQQEHREAFLIQDGNHHSAIAIIKPEETNDVNIEGPALKICTFKVSSTGRGFRYGELLLRAIFDYIHVKNIPKAYVTCYSKQQPLMRFLTQFGFAEHGTLDNGEAVFVKRFDPQENDYHLSPLDFHRQFGPYKMQMETVETFVIPIQPKYHKLLFPNLEEQLNLFAGERACGNSILKAYLCNASLKTLPPGSLVLFYRSQDASYVQAVGVVDECMRSSSADEIAQFVGKRTVYSLENIKDISQKETLAILFRYAKEISPVRLSELIDNNVLLGPPQTITRTKSEARRWIQARIEP